MQEKQNRKMRGVIVLLLLGHMINEKKIRPLSFVHTGVCKKSRQNHFFKSFFVIESNYKTNFSRDESSVVILHAAPTEV